MNPATELAPQLKQLRLSGILDSLDARNRQAIDAKLAYTEFLALLIQDEIARREQKKFGTRLRRAAFRATKTLEGFEFDRLPSTNRALVHDLATGALHRRARPGADRRPLRHREKPSGAGARALRRASGARRHLRLLRATARQPERRPRGRHL